MLYFVGIRALGEEEYIHTDNCHEHEFHAWLKRASILMATLGKKLFVDFRARPHTFEIKSDGKPRLITSEENVSIDNNILDPALEAQFAGS